MDALLGHAITGFVGGLLGLAASTLLLRMQQQQAIARQVVDIYFEMRATISDGVARIAQASLETQMVPGDVAEHRRAVSTLFYKYYDLLPRSALNELVCLFAALGDKDGRVYGVTDTAILPLEEEEIRLTIEKLSYYRTTREYTARRVFDARETVRFNAAVNIHARRVLLAFTEILEPDKLRNLLLSIRKPFHPKDKLRPHHYELPHYN